MNQANSNQFLINTFLMEMFAVSNLQSSAIEGDESAVMALPYRTQSLANLSAAIAHLNKGDVTQIDTNSLDQAWVKLKLESTMTTHSCTNTNPHRAQVADLILVDDAGNDLAITSDLIVNDGGSSMSFQVGEPEGDGARYQVTLKIEELDSGKSSGDVVNPDEKPET
jgi:hypothetical protein